MDRHYGYYRSAAKDVRQVLLLKKIHCRSLPGGGTGRKELEKENS